MTSINSIYINMTNMTNMTNSTIDCKNFLNSLVKPTLYSFTSDFYNEYIYLPNANSNKLKYQRLSSNSSKDISKDSKKNMIHRKHNHNYNHNYKHNYKHNQKCQNQQQIFTI